MYSSFEPYSRALAGLGPILYRHIFLLVNFIIFAVVGLLYSFGDTRAALFIGIIIVVNMLMGIVQDFKARVDLEKLQLLTALRVVRIAADDSEEPVLAEGIQKGDRIRLHLGDQVPCDGTLIDSRNLEVSEALLTGESDSFAKKTGEHLLGGAIVTAGSGVYTAETTFAESRMAKMSREAKKYSTDPSPIQRAVATVIKYSGYVLLASIAFILVRGFMVGAPYVQMVNNIGALASIIVPQGLVVITTLLFAFGAASYSSRHVLFQEINATEKLGRIKNLCMDKTGTLTDNALIVEDLYVAGTQVPDEVKKYMAAYIAGSGDSSQTIQAVGKYVGETQKGEILEALPFSSWRQYGAVRVYSDGKNKVIFVGPPDIFLPYITDATEHAWLKKLITEYSTSGKRVLTIATSGDASVPQSLSNVRLSIAGIFVFKSTLREGIEDTITFFQDRGIHIRILTGDNPETARAVALAAGVEGTDRVITGKEMEQWSEGNFLQNAKQYTIFARILPEQKVKIIEALKKDGFTAMVGDGANDALAIKKSDLGIAMFDGAPATRQLASVVLMNNSFTALPGGVTLADNFIRNLEIFARIFLYQSLIGLFTFILVALLGYPFPLTPLNITLINYFTVGVPGMLIGYWALKPEGKIPQASTAPFLRRVLPLPLILSVIGAIGVACIFASGPEYLKTAPSNTLVLYAFALIGLLFFVIAARASGPSPRSHARHLALLGLFLSVLLGIILSVPWLISFFTVTMPLPPFADTALALLIALVSILLQYIAARRFMVKWPGER